MTKTISLLSLLSLLVLSSVPTSIAEVIYGRFNISIPYHRYQLWNDLDTNYQQMANSLGYDKDKWEVLYTNEITNQIELFSYFDLATTEYLVKQEKNIFSVESPNQVLKRMGFTENSWNCWTNHYYGYSWDDLRVDEIASPYESLGWNQRAWHSEDEDDYPESYFKAWDELNNDEKQAAATMCYVPETWNEEGFDSLMKSEYLTSGVEPWITQYGNDNLIYSQWEISMPRYRFVSWKNLSVEERNLASQVGYTAVSWDKFFINEIEMVSFGDLKDTEYLTQDDIISISDSPNNVLTELGFDENSWDCWINHFLGYRWEDLVQYEIVDSYEALGWTQNMWESYDESPASSSKAWRVLSDGEKQAAANLCYLPETWDGQSLLQYLANSKYIASNEPWVPTAVPSNRPSNRPTTPPTVDPTVFPTVSPTVSQIPPTASPVTPTASPITSTASPVDPTASPVYSTASPVDPTASPDNPTALPNNPTASPVDPTAPSPIDPINVVINDDPTKSPIMEAGISTAAASTATSVHCHFFAKTMSTLIITFFSISAFS